ncbi:MAG: hypothetical protein L0Y66_10315 [Myxococcaceae bacterium]|nr:hypothetical protein [Myxococcaceae bacterium]
MTKSVFAFAGVLAVLIGAHAQAGEIKIPYVGVTADEFGWAIVTDPSSIAGDTPRELVVTFDAEIDGARTIVQEFWVTPAGEISGNVFVVMMSVFRADGSNIHYAKLDGDNGSGWVYAIFQPILFGKSTLFIENSDRLEHSNPALSPMLQATHALVTSTAMTKTYMALMAN